MPETCLKYLYKHMKVVLFKKRLQKTANIRKMRPSWKLPKCPQCKGYSPCKTLSLGQKMKFDETCQRQLYKHNKVVLCKKRLQKTASIQKMRLLWKLPKMATMQKLYSPCKALSLGQKINLPKTCQKHLYKHIKVVLCKKRLEETANIRKMRPLWKLPKMATMQGL